MKKALGVILIGLAALVAGCQKTGQVAKAQETKTVTFEAQAKPAKAVYLCGAPTKAGGTCKRHVSKAGELCWMHRAK